MLQPSSRTPGPLGAFTLLSVACLTIVVGCAIVPGLPGIAKALDVERGAGWLVTTPALGVVLFGYPAGRMIDRIGAYLALCVGLLLYALLGMGGALLRGATAVFADRLLLGGATALVMAGGTALISEFYTGAKRLSMIARQGMAIELGGVVFLAIGGVLTGVGWAAPFALYGVALLFLAMLAAFVPRPRTTSAEDQSTDGGSSLRPAQMPPVLLAGFASMLVFFAAIVLLPFDLARPDGASLSEAQTGYYLACVSLVAVGFAAIMPRLARSIGQRRTLIAAFLCYGAAHVAFAASSDLIGAAMGGVLLGAGFGLSIPLVNHMTIERSHALRRGRNLSQLSMAIFLGQFLASAVGFVPGGRTMPFAASALLAFATSLYGVLSVKHTMTRRSSPLPRAEGSR